MVSAAPSTNACPIVLYGPAATALRIACLLPGRTVVAFDTDWAAIDDARQAASDMGLGERVHIHHMDAASGGSDIRRGMQGLCAA